MARKARSEILYDGCYSHVFSRSIEKRKIFKDKDDFGYFLQLLKKEKQSKEFKIYHYCLMHTHFHLVVGIERLQLFSQALQQIKWKYTRQYNGKYQRWGPLWRERFKSMLIEDERYMHACGQYVEQNPLKAGIVEQERDWEYSSARHYAGTDKDELIDYYEYQGMPEDEDIEEEDFTRGWLIGSGWFKYRHLKGIA